MRSSTTCRRYTPTSTSPTRCSSTPERRARARGDTARARDAERGASPWIVLGIDPGTTGMGYALVLASTDPPTVADCGQVPVPFAAATAYRLLAIADALDALIRRHRPVALALERLYFNKNARTALAVSEARGIALLCAARARLEIAEYTPQEVKISVTGNGRGDKRAVQRMLPRLVSLAAPITQDNVADAVAIALTHAQRARFARAVAATGR